MITVVRHVELVPQRLGIESLHLPSCARSGCTVVSLRWNDVSSFPFSNAINDPCIRITGSVEGTVQTPGQPRIGRSILDL